MSDAFDERRKGLENEYFRRKDKESLDRLRAALREEAQQEGARGENLHCPRCGHQLAETTIEGAEVDHCENCGGIWLDAGELEQLTKREQGGWLSRVWQNFSGS